MLNFLRRRSKEKTDHAVKKTRQTWFGRVSSLFNRSQLDDDLWDELEELLISADVGVGTTVGVLDNLKERVKQDNISEPSEALDILKQEMVNVIQPGDPADVLSVKEPPLVLLVVGVNGVGKTTSIAKLAHLYMDNDKQVLLGAADTYRAAATEQLQVWGKRLDIDVIAHRSGADPGAVAYDTLQAGKARGSDVVIIDTAGRLHTRFNLMEELKKINSVIRRQGSGDSVRTLLTLDATTGQNGLAQARSFVEAVDCDGVFLAKLDGTAKGGVVFAIASELKLPVLYIGTGEQPDDIAAFDAREFVESLLASPDGR